MKVVANDTSVQMPVTTGLEKVPSVRFPVNSTFTPSVLSLPFLPVAVTTKAVLVPLHEYSKFVLSVLIVPAYAVHFVWASPLAMPPFSK